MKLLVYFTIFHEHDSCDRTTNRKRTFLCTGMSINSSKRVATFRKQCSELATSYFRLSRFYFHENFVIDFLYDNKAWIHAWVKIRDSCQQVECLNVWSEQVQRRAPCSLSFDLTLGPGLVFALNFLSDFRAPFRIEAPWNCIRLRALVMTCITYIDLQTKNWMLNGLIWML